MKNESKSKDQLLKEIKDLQQQVKKLKLYKHILDQLPVCTIFYDQFEKVIYRNKATRLIDGYDDEEMLGLNRIEYLKRLQIKPGKEISKVILPPAIIDNFDDGIFTLTETTLLQKNGSTRPVLLNGSYIFDESDNFVGVCGCALDLTDYDKKEKIYRLVLETLPNPIYFKDANGLYQGCNAAFENLFGKSKEEIIGHSVDIWPKHMKDKIREMDEKLYQNPGTQVYETKISHADGSQHDVILNKATYSATSNAQIDGLVGVITDITEYKHLKEEMGRLDRLNLIGEMAASIGHEVRNPITTVRGFLQILKGKKECVNYNDFFDLMIEELDRANSIITHFLSLAKNKPVNKVRQNLNHIIETIFPLIQASANKDDKNINLEINDTPNLLLDEKEIRQLILNLVRNGLEAMSPGKTLSIKTYTDKDNVIMAVQDQGSGIEAALIDKLGTPFLTTKDNGTGLGLSVCYSIVERHQAKIDLETGPTGTTFFVRFKV
ncbi:PAS domain S-box-containing protein [Desulfotomaculum arcticum]|uniref:histidine kinase n=1 Tax=Desulfotruncus arcticus DSM 17038 TaxID=1121424 RepID=A0A1I2QQQ3_9FIRM|nr:PAS domain-containing sensor histidine kinase [Desulfotruncus arcticus]SFG27986.1 PAS domain S-box-containing protein [Desulfotomaculum arcticum] [Desulfotruncus arcticus DSM 17038]